MRKLKLESLQVESFETTAGSQGVRGTVQGHAPNTVGCPGGTGVSDCAICQPGTIDLACQPLTYDYRDCGVTNPLYDCTYGCTRNTCDRYVNSCGDVCWIDPDQSAACQIG
jgi:hypothetical protein